LFRTTISVVLVCLTLGVAQPGSSTTWGSVEHTCPVCGETIELDAIASYGSYIYRWPSKLQLIFWPDTDTRGVQFCVHCHHAALLGDFGELPPEVVERVAEALAAAREEQEGARYDEVSILYRLRMARVAYEARGKDEWFWCRFHRIHGYHLEEAGQLDAAREARLEALTLAEGMLAAAEPVAPAKELMFIAGSMRAFAGQEREAAESLARVASTAMEPLPPGMNAEDAAGYGGYLDGLAMELLGQLEPPAEDSSVTSRTYDFSDETVEGELVQPTGAYLAPARPVALPDAGRGGPKSLERREAWVERQLGREGLPLERRVGLMADMAARIEGGALDAWSAALADYDRRWEEWFAAGASEIEPPEPDLSAVDERWDAALVWYDRILAEPGSEPWRPEALAGSVRILLRADREAGAAIEAQRLLDQAPESPHAPWAAVVIGDHYFTQNNVVAAADAYRLAAGGDDPALGCYASYKLAWCQYNLGDTRDAVDTIAGVIERARDLSPGPADHLQEEGMKDLIRMAAGLPVDEMMEALATVCTQGDASCQAWALERLVRLLEDSGRSFDAREIRNRASGL
jgi:hypothetical protein